MNPALPSAPSHSACGARGRADSHGEVAGTADRSGARQPHVAGGGSRAQRFDRCRLRAPGRSQPRGSARATSASPSAENHTPSRTPGVLAGVQRCARFSTSRVGSRGRSVLSMSAPGERQIVIALLQLRVQIGASKLRDPVSAKADSDTAAGRVQSGWIGGAVEHMAESGVAVQAGSKRAAQARRAFQSTRRRSRAATGAMPGHCRFRPAAVAGRASRAGGMKLRRSPLTTSSRCTKKSQRAEHAATSAGQRNASPRRHGLHGLADRGKRRRDGGSGSFAAASAPSSMTLVSPSASAGTMKQCGASPLPSMTIARRCRARSASRGVRVRVNRAAVLCRRRCGSMFQRRPDRRRARR